MCKFQDDASAGVLFTRADPMEFFLCRNLNRNNNVATMADTPDSGASTPNASRFTSQALIAEDRLKADTVGLVTLDDFRKRRAEALEADSSAPASGTATPDGRYVTRQLEGLKWALTAQVQ